MTRRRWTSSLVSCFTLAAVVGLGIPPASGIANPARYASPGGSGDACTQADPCSLPDAVNSALGDQQVLIEPGNYGPYDVSLSDEGHPGLDIRGVAGAARTVITSSASRSFDLNGSSLSGVTVHSSGDNSAIAVDGGTVDHVIVIATADDATACSVLAPISDSVCVATGLGGNGMAIEVGTTGPSTVTYNVPMRGVTAEGTASDAAGLVVSTGAFAAVNLTATNDIIHGGYRDVVASTDAPTAVAKVVLHHSDYLTTLLLPGTGTASITGDATDIHGAPKFVNAASGDYRETAQSPTVNKGAADPRSDTDVVGAPRTLGSAPDMGAFELAQKPTAHGLKVTKKTKHAAKLSVKVNPDGLRTTVKLVATHAGHRVISAKVSVGSGGATKTVRLRLHGLTSRTTYKVHAVATNKDGHADSTKKTIHTR